MDETARNARNAQRLTELYPVFAQRIRTVIAALEAQGFRPRIQDAWRSPADQLKAFQTGHSKLEFGFHNVTGANGRQESLAVDLLDDDFPVASRTEYLLRLAAVAGTVRCQTGVAWGLPAALKQAVLDAVANGDFAAPVKIGWDPTHVEPTDVTVAAARAGARPETPAAAPTRGRSRRAGEASATRAARGGGDRRRKKGAPSKKRGKKKRRRGG
jgi:hypothetical protein